MQDFDGLKVVVAAPSRRWLEGIVLDYVEIEPGRHDFAFLAPTADNGTARSTAPAADPGPPPGSGPGCGSGGCGGCGR